MAINEWMGYDASWGTPAPDEPAPTTTPTPSPPPLANTVSNLSSPTTQAPTNPYTGQQVTSSTGQSYAFDDIVNQVNVRYGEGKDPSLVVKSALQLGLPKEVIMQLPGVTDAAFTSGQNLISSGAFAPTATGTAADGVQMQTGGATTDWNTYQARKAAGLDAYGYPAAQVEQMKANGTYIEPTLPTNPNQQGTTMATLGGAGEGDWLDAFKTTPSITTTTPTTTPMQGASTSPSWLTALNSQPANPGVTGTNSYVDPSNNFTYAPIYSPGSYQGMDNYTPGELTGYAGGVHSQGGQYEHYDLQGNPTGQYGNWSDEKDMYPLYAAALAMVGGGLAAGGAFGGAAGTAGATGATEAAVGGGLEAQLAAYSAEAMSAYGGAGAAAASQVSGIIGMGGAMDMATIMEIGAANGLSGSALTSWATQTGSQFGLGGTGPNFTQGYTDNGTAGGALDSQYASGSAGGTGGSITPGGTTPAPYNPTGATPPATTGAPPIDPASAASSATSLADLLKLVPGLAGLFGGVQDGKNQREASDKMLEWLKSRTAITDNLYADGSPERLAMQQEMDRKDAAAGRNSQYGVRAVDLASNIAKIKASENTKMTTGIGQWMQGAYNQNASSNAGTYAALNNLDWGGLINIINKIGK